MLRDVRLEVPSVQLRSFLLCLGGAALLVAQAGCDGASAEDPAAAASIASAAGVDAWTPPLSTRGRYIVDATGKRFKLRSGNWHGASGTWKGEGAVEDPGTHHEGEAAEEIPLGLDRAPMEEIVASFLALGINSVRLPFSNAMIHRTEPVADRSVAANPHLRGKTPLQIYDAAVEALTAARLAVIVNNHTNTSRWCCALDGNERWNTSQTEAAWQEDWLFMVRRYRGNGRVVGADLYNEVRRDLWNDPGWGRGGDHDWHRASQRLGDRILAEANPDILVIVEGINWVGLPFDLLPHARPTLEPVRTLSHTLVRSHKLVYSAHVYGFTGPRHSGATGLGETHDPRYRDLDRDQLFEVVDRQAGYVALEADTHFTAPVWFSEFGTRGRLQSDPKEKAWFERFVEYLVLRDADFAYWPLVGFHEQRTGNNWALMSWDAAGARAGLFDGDDWRAPLWARLIGAPGKTGTVASVAAWSMLSSDAGDLVQSLAVRATGDWDAGAVKVACRDGERLAGMSHSGFRALCTDVQGGAPGAALTVVRDGEARGEDWAAGRTKLECPAGSLAIGFARRAARLSSILCAGSDRRRGARRTVWFDRADQRPPSAGGGDFASGHFKGQCEDDERIVGVAVGDRRTPDALLCERTL